MAGAAYKDFSDLIAAGERIEILAKAGKLPMGNEDASQSKKGFQPRKKESEVNYVQNQQAFVPRSPLSYPQPRTPYLNFTPPNPFYQTTPTSQIQVNHIPTVQPYPTARPTYAPYPNAPPQTYQNQVPPRPNFQNQNRPQFQNLPPFPKLSISNADLFQRLFDAHLVSENPVRPMQPPFPAWYNPNVTCRYHMGVAGHSIEDCEGFKTAVRKLIACGKLDLQEGPKPDIVNNPMPNHGGRNQVNTLEISESLIKKVGSLRTPMYRIFEGLKKAGYDITAPTSSVKKDEEHDEGLSCVYHCGGIGHDIENCQEFKVCVQGLLTLGVIQVSQKSDLLKEVSVIEPFVLHVPPLNQVPSSEKVVITINKPTPFKYKDNRAVPWNYGTNVETKWVEGETSRAYIEDTVTNVAEVGGITRSGRYYNPKEAEKGKMIKEGNAEEIVNPERKGIDEEEDEFLKIMKQSEYDILDQLKKTPARISLLSLVLMSEAHRNALLRVLKEAYVKPDVTTESMVNMVDPVKRVNMITFSEEEIVMQSDPRPLHITLKCKGYIIARVLIDGGSGLNVLPKTTLTQLSMGMEDLSPQVMVVKAFDGSKRSILGEIVLPLEIGPSKFEVLFQVMNIDSAYTMLLGRPWINAAGAVIYFASEGQIC